ncbi:MAG TPA: BON domain-containing protein [Candidatus Limnocylindrales bacterium]|nr:BON domain-containing protein [Candidatus Limnocylindrales bacterium]
MISKSAILTKGRAGSLAALLAIAFATPALAANAPADAWITTKVKISLATTEGVSSTNVNVDTVDRQVTLHGTVNTDAERQAAERTAKAVQGTAGVRNLLQVVPARQEAAVEEKDDAISQRVTAALSGDPSLKDSTITVQSVNKGVVLLMGKATTLSDQLTAIEIATAVKGVRRVASEIQSQETLADADVWMERNVPVGTQPATTRSAANDLYITSMVKMRLLGNAATPAMEINVDTRAGVVTLFGMVPTAESKSIAEAEAKKAGGVASVKNELQVVPNANQPTIEAKDDVIQGNVKTNLARHAELISVSSEVKNCVVRLTGSVASGTDRVQAMQVARATRGVCSVSGDLVIR